MSKNIGHAIDNLSVQFTLMPGLETWARFENSTVEIAIKDATEI